MRNSITADDLIEALRQAGYDCVYTETDSEADLDPILADAEGLIVAAGGDGTVRAVVTRVIGQDVALAVVPLGTANNIGRTLGMEGPPLQIVAGLESPRKRPFDVGHVESPWDQRYFLEALGYGFYADTLAAYRPDEGKSILRGIDAIRETLVDYKPHACQMTLDGEDISGQYLMVEVLNTPAFGPRLKVAPDADPGDGLLEIVRIRQDFRDGWLDYLANLMTEDLEDLPSVERTRGKKLEIRWTGFPIHIDAEVRPETVIQSGVRKPLNDVRDNGAKESFITVEVMPNAIEVWLPNLDDEAAGLL